MKTSNKIMLITLCGVALIILVVAIVARIAWGGNFTPIVPGKEITKTIEVKDFTGISVSAVWQIDVKRGDTYSVTITVPENLLEDIIVETRGTTLAFDQRRSMFGGGNLKLRASIVMPDIARLDCSGVADVTISGFTTSTLDINSSGVGSIKVQDSTIENLVVELSGVGNVDTSDAKSNNANVHVSGVGSLKVRMNGGVLRGSLSGVGSIEYSGEVSSQEIEKSGLGSVHRQ